MIKEDTSDANTSTGKEEGRREEEGQDKIGDRTKYNNPDFRSNYASLSLDHGERLLHLDELAVLFQGNFENARNRS